MEKVIKSAYHTTRKVKSSLGVNNLSNTCVVQMILAHCAHTQICKKGSVSSKKVERCGAVGMDGPSSAGVRPGPLRSITEPLEGWLLLFVKYCGVSCPALCIMNSLKSPNHSHKAYKRLLFPFQR